MKQEPRPPAQAAALLGIGNNCRNSCTYCGMSTWNKNLPRFRLSLKEIQISLQSIQELSINRVFLISGEDGGRSTRELTMIIEEAAKSGIEVLAAFGEFPGEVYREFKKAGLTGYALKFETSNEKLYREIKPGKELKTRLKAMEAIRTAEIGLATGSIIGLAGQNETIREQDRMLTLQWDPFWVPIVPYLPVPGTPMASTDNRPETAEAVRLTLEEIRHLRRLLPHTLITANQPSLTAAEEGRPLSFADLEGRQAALKAGANFLFWDATPAARRGDLQITENRKLPDWQEVRSLLNENTVSGA